MIENLLNSIHVLTWTVVRAYYNSILLLHQSTSPGIEQEYRRINQSFGTAQVINSIRIQLHVVVHGFSQHWQRSIFISILSAWCPPAPSNAIAVGFAIPFSYILQLFLSDKVCPKSSAAQMTLLYPSSRHHDNWSIYTTHNEWWMVQINYRYVDKTWWGEMRRFLYVFTLLLERIHF